ncbi:kinectin isoform X2 [Brienomyrus brachyistius]|uniref:kinectin isoform X2 n=1 Tax=Brienomyrus brachyistius TaxID=42636 RepID=UPI0020B1E5DC|nr:kinectin isoform X2 [Brienomyrus brachyistius]
MMMDFYDSQYLLILAPSLVIALMFLFFWLFMKETSYDEVLARQRRDLRPVAARPDARKKGEKKKSKKREAGGGGSSGGGGESEEDHRELDLTDAVASPPPEDEEPAQVMPAPTPTPIEPPPSLRERKKKERKQQQQHQQQQQIQQQQQQQQQVAVTTRAAPPPVSEEQVPTRELNGSKATPRKSEPTLAVSKQPSPPPPEPVGKKKGSQKKQKNEADELHLEIKVEQSSAPPKKEVPVSAEMRVQENAMLNPSTGAAPPSTTITATTTTSIATTTTGGGKKKNSAKKQKTGTEPVPAPPEQTCVAVDREPTAHANPQKGHLEDVPPKVSAKKMKNEANKENSEVKLREFIAGLRSLVLSEEDTVSVATVLREKNPSALDAWHRSTAKPEPSAQKLQEKERMLTTLQEESSIAKEKVKQLNLELQAEKQKTVRVEALLREQRGALEEQQNVLQASYQMKYQQALEQLEGQIARLQQENNILRDAVSTGESKQSSELNQLRGECARLMKELSEASGKHQQEERQRKSLEVGYKQNVSQLEAQLQDAKRRWEEVQGFLHSVSADRENLQASKQDLQNQLLSAESEMSNKNKEIQTLRTNLTDVMVSKEQVEQRLMQLLEVSQHAQQDTSLQEQLQNLVTENKALQVQIDNLQSQLNAQTTTAFHFDELQKLLSDKELQRKSLEDTLNVERSSAAGRETEMQAMRTEIMAQKAEMQNMQTQLSEQARSQLALDAYQKSIQEKDDKIKTVEELLEMGLIEVANKEEDLKKLKEENEALKRDVEARQQHQREQTPPESVLEELQRMVQEKDERLKMLEEKLQAEFEKMLKQESVTQELEKQVKSLTAEVDLSSQREATEAEASGTRLRELQALLVARDEEVQVMQRALEMGAKETTNKEQQVQALQEECMILKAKVDDQQVVKTEGPSQEMLDLLAAKEGQVSDLEKELTELRASLELQRKKNNELREKNWSAMEALSATESMLQGKLCKTVQDGQKAVEVAEAECRDILQRLFPSVPLPASRNHQEWLHRFEAAAKDVATATAGPGPAPELEQTKILEEKLKESEEAQKILQKDCEMYKKVLAETEGILQRLQSSVEQEESRWRVKLDVSQNELKEMNVKMVALENEVDRLTLECGDLENVRCEKQHLELELERAERESASYVTEVRELKDLLTELQSKLDGSYTEAVRQNEELNVLKTQLTKTLFKLETEENERQKVAGDLYKAQQSLDQIQAEILKETVQADLIENSTFATQDEMNRKSAAGLNETVIELQRLLHGVNRKLLKGKEEDGEKETPEV